ncbi:6-bladed beta-propeller [uncultured Parabacteroides sp.]|uniref:6-bladed beta-propeller n=1 Tax=uncultured Parabacteroides sp. TaxID=512312 RepID=UPI0026126C2D|nr:6-bladed beta-propeller [uncultured Parabacteroides sp.]
MKLLNGMLLLGACLFISACRQETVSGLQTLTLDRADRIDPDMELPLDALGMTVEAIPLETTDSCLIKDIFGLEESRDFYWLLFNNRIGKFDKAGRFLQYIGTAGQGPGEYVSAKVIQPVEEEQRLYVMDYFGRKMNVYGFDGSFIRTFRLPEETWMDNFRYKDSKVYYQTTGNSVMPDIFCYDVQAGRMDTICKREREMGTEGYAGQSYIYTLDGDMYTYHYFNDTIYRLDENRIEPAWLFQTGKMKWTYDELTMMADFTPKVRPDGPRIQVFDLFETNAYRFVFYTISEYKGEKMKPFMALYDKKQDRFYPHLNLISPEAPWLSVRKGAKLIKTSVPGSLYAIKEAVDLAGKKGFERVKEDDNPVLVRYVCN